MFRSWLIFCLKTIRSKWVLKIRHKVDGSTDKYKAHLVMKGYNQRESIYYEKIVPKKNDMM